MVNTISSRPPSVAQSSKPYGVRDVPESLTRGAEAGELTMVTAKKGDSLWKIWKASGRPCAWKDFLALNKHLGEKLFPGDSVAVPSTRSAPQQPDRGWGAHGSGADAAARPSGAGDVYEAAPAGKAVSSGTGTPIRTGTGTEVRTSDRGAEAPRAEREPSVTAAPQERDDVVRTASGTAVQTEHGAVRTKPVERERYGRE